MLTIGGADYLGLPVSTTHVLSSGIAGTMAANHTGLQWSTVRNLAMAWVLTLLAAMLLSGFPVLRPWRRTPSKNMDNAELDGSLMHQIQGGG